MSVEMGARQGWVWNPNNLCLLLTYLQSPVILAQSLFNRRNKMDPWLFP